MDEAAPNWPFGMYFIGACLRFELGVVLCFSSVFLCVVCVFVYVCLLRTAERQCTARCNKKGSNAIYEDSSYKKRKTLECEIFC